MLIEYEINGQDLVAMNLNAMKLIGIKSLSIRIQLLNQVLKLQKPIALAVNQSSKRDSVISDLYTPDVSPYLGLKGLNESAQPVEEYIVAIINRHL